MAVHNNRLVLCSHCEWPEPEFFFPGPICTRPVTDFIVNRFSHIAVQTEVALKKKKNLIHLVLKRDHICVLVDVIENENKNQIQTTCACSVNITLNKITFLDSPIKKCAYLPTIFSNSRITLRHQLHSVVRHQLPAMIGGCGAVFEPCKSV